ncbi:MAG: hypothetical protein U5K69_09395 [Balneolaceae bacterium]|nr:hypothetical protein [Balneolaceae bacterium]
MGTLAAIDWIVIALYFVVLIVLAWWVITAENRQLQPIIFWRGDIWDGSL